MVGRSNATLKKSAIILFALFAACSENNFVTQEFSFPSKFLPHESGWKYRGTVKISGKGPWLEFNTKSIEIFVLNRSDKEVLIDRIAFSSGPLQVTTNWEVEHILSIKLIEEGNKFGNGRYNEFLLKRGPLLIRNLTYDPVSIFAK